MRVALDARERPFHCHHEKLVIVDGALAFVGGIDLTAYAGDRLDTASIPPAAGSAGTTPPPASSGPAVADVADHFRLRWQEVTGEQLPPRRRPLRPASRAAARAHRARGDLPALPRGEFTILESYLRALRARASG